MHSSNPVLSALRIAKPDEFARKVRAALERGGSVPAAAKALGVATRTLHRWISEAPALAEGVALPPPRSTLRGSTGPAARATRTPAKRGAA